jgi:hypothetical protein
MLPASPTAATLRAVFSTVRLPTLEESAGQQSVFWCISFSVNNRKTIIVIGITDAVVQHGAILFAPAHGRQQIAKPPAPQLVE